MLRGHAASDLDDVFALWNDPLVVRYIGGKLLTREEVWMRLLRHVGHWILSGYGFWVACERTTGRVVGEIGLADFRRGLDPPFAPCPEAGWVIASWLHGQGFASETMAAVFAWGMRRR